MSTAAEDDEAPFVNRSIDSAVQLSVAGIRPLHAEMRFETMISLDPHLNTGRLSREGRIYFLDELVASGILPASDKHSDKFIWQVSGCT